MKCKKIEIDVPQFKKWIAGTGMSCIEISKKIGRSVNYISNVVCAGSMSEMVYLFLLKTFGLPDGSFLPKKEEPKPEEKKPAPVLTPLGNVGYWTDLVVSADRVKLSVYFRDNGIDEEVCHASSWIKGNKELDVMQAISYAAHMCYKVVEQRALES